MRCSFVISLFCCLTLQNCHWIKKAQTSLLDDTSRWLYICATHSNRGIKMLFSIWYTEQFPDKVDKHEVQIRLRFLCTWLLKWLYVAPFKTAKVIFPWTLSSPPFTPWHILMVHLCLRTFARSKQEQHTCEFMASVGSERPRLKFFPASLPH